MSRTKVEFTNRAGQTLAGALELPEAGESQAMAIFAHCFTCGKDVVAASRIARALATHGIGVLRFDFTGLGGSDGDFGSTSFSSNVSDLEAAAEYLAREHQAPRLLIGHSLGGAAVLVAARRIKSIDAVVTIAAPATPEHLRRLFADQACDIRSEGQAEVNIAGRPFNIGADLLEDLEQWPLERILADLHKPLLIFHSPADQVVNINEAATIYTAAQHPKSFVSLDDADHLLSQRADADYVALTLTAWASRYLKLDNPKAVPQMRERPKVDPGQVLASEANQKFLLDLFTADHHLRADEPKSSGGGNQGPNPYDLLLMSLGACTAMTLRMYARHKSLPVENIQVRLNQQNIHAKDCEECEHKEGKVHKIERVISYQGDLTEEQQQRLLDIADKCPVHKTLTGHIHIATSDSHN